MANKKFAYRVHLHPLEVPNQEQSIFRDELNAIPYLLYEVEQLATGEKVVINKPGGKRNFGRLSRDDFMVFIYNPSEESLWLISHGELLEDLITKHQNNPAEARKLVAALCGVCCGQEPDDVLRNINIADSVGIPSETILKTYKWIWGQEDCNYPRGEGRWLSMNGILNQFGMTKEDCEAFTK